MTPSVRCFRQILIGVIGVVLVAGCARRLPSVPGPGAADASSQTQKDATGQGSGSPSGGTGTQGTIEERERQVREESLRRDMEKKQSPATTQLTSETFMSEDVRFDYNSFTLSGEAKQVLEQKAQWLVENPNVSVQIEGHCDERGTVAYNLALGERRANVVKQYMTALGVEGSRMNTISYGEEFALDPAHNEEAWARNRRAHFAILGPS